MKKISHTPTPWEVVTYEHSIFGETTFDYGIISTISEIPICNLDPTYNDTLTSEVCKENAEFICKAVNEYDKLKEQEEKDQETIKSLIKQLKNNITTCLYFKSIQLPSPGAKEIIISQLENNKELLSKIEK